MATLACLIGSLPRIARATPAFETYPGSRPDSADRFMVPLREALLAEGVGARPAQVIESMCHVPRPAQRDRTQSGDAIADELELNIKLWVHNKFKDAATNLTTVLQVAADNTGVVSQSGRAVDAEGRALVALALSWLALGDEPDAEAAMLDYLRAFDQEVSRDTFGPAAVALSERVKKKHAHDARGKLIVAVTNPDAQVFVNEIGRGRGATYEAALLPGSYRVVIRVGDVALRYDAAVKPNEETRLSIDWGIESRLTVSDTWVGVAGAPADDERERSDAVAFAKLDCRDSTVVALSMTVGGISDIVSGKFYDAVRGVLKRRGKVIVPHGSDAGEKLRHLAHYLFTGEPSSDVTTDAAPIEAVATSAEPSASPATAERSPSSRVIPIALTTVGGVALIVGGVMISQTNVPSRLGVQEPMYTNYRPPGIGIAIGGVASLGVGLVMLLWHRDPQAATVGFQPLPAGGGATVGWSF